MSALTCETCGVCVGVVVDTRFGALPAAALCVACSGRRAVRTPLPLPARA